MVFFVFVFVLLLLFLKVDLFIIERHCAHTQAFAEWEREKEKASLRLTPC